MNTDAPWPDLAEAESRVLHIQAKLHQRAVDDPHRRFDDLFNLVADPAFLVVAWDRVRGNRGARSAGVDGVAPRAIVFGKERFLTELRDDLKARRFLPLPVREKLIPKKSGKLRGLGIPTARDRTVQAALKLVLEPIFEADFQPCSYGFRPRRRAQDAIEEIFFYATHSYEWVLERDIESCFDEIDHTALVDRVRHRIGDKRVLSLVKAFLKAGILGEDQGGAGYGHRHPPGLIFAFAHELRPLSDALGCEQLDSGETQPRRPDVLKVVDLGAIRQVVEPGCTNVVVDLHLGAIGEAAEGPPRVDTHEKVREGVTVKRRSHARFECQLPDPHPIVLEK